MKEGRTRPATPFKPVYMPEDVRNHDCDNQLGALGLARTPGVDGIERFKKSRARAKIEEVLREVCEKTKDQEEDLIHAAAEALQAGGTMGEIAGMMRIAYGYPYDPHGMIESPV